jgi:hypothetical protein
MVQVEGKPEKRRLKNFEKGDWHNRFSVSFVVTQQQKRAAAELQRTSTFETTDGLDGELPRNDRRGRSLRDTMTADFLLRSSTAVDSAAE